MAETERGTLFDGSRTFSTPDVASKATGPGLYLDLTFSATSPGIMTLSVTVVITELRDHCVRNWKTR